MAVLTESNVASLAKLHPIHEPAPIGIWPLAIGWQGLLCLGGLLLLVGSYGLWRWYQQGLAKREALRLLVSYEKAYRSKPDTQLAAACIASLLKRVALVYFPRAQVAQLHGEAWLLFLENTSHNLDFLSQRDTLLLCPYQSHGAYALDALFRVSRAWIKQRRKPCLS